MVQLAPPLYSLYSSHMSDIDHPALYPDIEPHDAAPDAYVRLRPAEKVFVEAYLANMGTSAKAAGKSIADMIGQPTIDNSDRANKMLKLPHVKAAIRQRAKALAAKFEVSGNSLMKEIASIAFANMANYVTIGENGEPIIDLSNCTYDQMSAISEITVEDFTDGRGDNARDVRKIKLKLHDKQTAQEKLMKYLQLYAPERVDITVNVNSQNLNVDMTAEQLSDMYQQRLRKVGG